MRETHSLAYVNPSEAALMIGAVLLGFADSVLNILVTAIIGLFL